MIHTLFMFTSKYKQIDRYIGNILTWTWIQFSREQLRLFGCMQLILVVLLPGRRDHRYLVVRYTYSYLCNNYYNIIVSIFQHELNSQIKSSCSSTHALVVTPCHSGGEMSIGWFAAKLSLNALFDHFFTIDLTLHARNMFIYVYENVYTRIRN